MLLESTESVEYCREIKKNIQIVVDYNMDKSQIHYFEKKK